jgi:hypothetical protein
MWSSASTLLITNFSGFGRFTLETNLTINGGVLRAIPASVINNLLPASSAATPASTVRITATTTALAASPVKAVALLPSVISGFPSELATADATQSQGALGRPLAFFWYYQIATDANFTAASVNLDQVQLASSTLFSTSSVTKLTPPCNCTILVTLVVTNWLGSSANVTLVVKILPESLIPNLVITNGTDIVVNRTTSILVNGGVITILTSLSNSSMFNSTFWNVTIKFPGDLYKDTPELQPPPVFYVNGSTLTINASSLIPGSTYVVVRTVCTSRTTIYCFSSTSQLKIPSTPVPVLKFARLSDSVNEIVLQFTSGTNQRNAPAQLACDLIVLNPTLSGAPFLS